MGLKLFSFLLLASFISCSPNQSSKQGSKKSNITIGLPTNESSRDIEGLAKALSDKLGEKVEVTASSSYSDALTDLQNENIEFAFLSPLVFVEAEKKADAKVLLKKVYGKSEFYFSALITLEKNKIKDLKDLKGKKIAFVDKKSASGYLYPKLMLSTAGLKDTDVEIVFKGSHPEALKALYSGEVDAAGVWAHAPELKTGSWTAPEFESQKEKILTLKYSAPIPNDAFVVHKHYFEENPDRVLKLMNALISLSDDKNQILKKVMGVDSLSTATSRHYDVVRRLQKNLAEAQK